LQCVLKKDVTKICIFTVLGKYKIDIISYNFLGDPVLDKKHAIIG